MRFFVPIIFALVLALPVSAQLSAPIYSNEFMNLGAGAANFGRGNTGTASANDAFTAWYNPAGLTELKTTQAGFMHSVWFAGVANYNVANYATKIDSNLSFGITGIRFSVDDIADTRFLVNAGQIDYSKIRTFNSSDNALVLSLAAKLPGKPQWSVGGNAKLIYRRAGNFGSAFGFGFDAGVRYVSNGLRFGITAKDITSTFNIWTFNTSELAPTFAATGNKIAESSIELSLPRLNLGIAKEFNANNWLDLTATLDLDITTDGKRNTLIKTNVLSADPKLGIEGTFYKLAFLRLGLSNIQQIEDFKGNKSTVVSPSYGAGIYYKGVRLDYALYDLNAGGGNLYSHIVSITVDVK